MDDDFQQERFETSTVEVARIAEELNDPDVDEALGYMVKLIAKPDIPAKVATPLITKMQAMSFQFKMQGKYYMLLGKGEPKAAIKKNLYLSMAEGTEQLAQALKYTTRNY